MNIVSLSPYRNVFNEFNSIHASTHFTDVETESERTKVFIQDCQPGSDRHRPFPLQSPCSVVFRDSNHIDLEILSEARNFKNTK